MTQAKDSSPRTPPGTSLFKAIERKFAGIVSTWVVEFNADVTKTNNNGQTPLQLTLTLPHQMSRATGTNKVMMLAALLGSPQYTNGTTNELKDLLMGEASKGQKNLYNLVQASLKHKPELKSRYQKLMDDTERAYEKFEEKTQHDASKTPRGRI